MWKTKYKSKMKVVSVLIVMCFMVLIGVTCSKVGVLAMNKEDYQKSHKEYMTIKNDKATYETILGDIYDTRGNPILINDAVIDEAVLNYHKSYSHLLGNVHLNDNGLLRRYYDTLSDKSANDTVADKGYSLELTLSDELQRFAYELTEGQRASIVVLKRHSGELLALTSTYEEDFDLSGNPDQEKLNSYNTADEPVWIPEYLNAYAPGSCEKIFSSAAAIESGMSDFTINDVGYVEYENAKISNVDGAFNDRLDMTDAFCVSSNTYFASLFNAMEIGNIRKYASAMMLGGAIDTDFGTVGNRFSFGGYSDFEIGLLGIGQMNELSSVGLALMVQGAIDNEIYRPHVIKNTCLNEKDGSLKIVDSTEEDLLTSGIFSDSTCERVRGLMETAARSEKYLLDKSILGAKSGTAEVEINGVDTDRASLVGYNDEYIIVVSKIEKDAFGISNKDTLEKVFKKLADISAY